MNWHGMESMEGHDRFKWLIGLLLLSLFPGFAQASQDFVVLGNEGVWIQHGSTILSGDIGANQVSTGPYLTGEQEITISQDVTVQNSDGQVMGNTVRLHNRSRIQHMAVNTVLGKGEVLGTVMTPLTLPLVSVMPPIPLVTPGEQDVNVPTGTFLTLQPGEYRGLRVHPQAAVILVGGQYDFRNWDIREGGRVYAAGSTEVRVSDRIDTHRRTVIGPAPDAPQLSARDLLIIGMGRNGSTGIIHDNDPAVRFGEESLVRAQVYVPHGLLWIKDNSQATGAFLGRWVRMGRKSTIALEGGFGLRRGTNAPPVAHAGADQTVQVGMTVQLDGADSTDVDGDLLTYTWVLLSRPDGSLANLSDITAIRPTLTIDMPGAYTIQLIVNDGNADSQPDVVTITTINSPPVAIAGPDQTVLVNQTVFLNGNNSYDVDGDLLSWVWSLVSVPSGSDATLSNATSVSPHFVVDRPGIYQVQLIVNDGHESSEPDMVTISTGNSRPAAHAGEDQMVPIGSTVVLDGSHSADVDGDPLSFLWAMLAKPAGSAAILSDSTAIHPTFVADLAGVYVVQLMVHDGKEESLPVTVTITTGNTPPVANAGHDQSVPVLALVTLNGSGSHDADGDALTFQWTLDSRPPGSVATILNPTFPHPTLIPDVPGTYVVSLMVSDGVVFSVPDTVAIVAQSPAPVLLPTLRILSPIEGSVVGISPISVAGFVGDSTAIVTVNGMVATVTGGMFLADGVVLQEGWNTLTVTGTDSGGNTNSINLGLTLSGASTYLAPIWGPVEWVKETAGAEIFTTNFLNCEPAAQYQLVVINGVAGGVNRMTQGSVLLNGVEVVSSLELTAEHSQIVKPIAVQARNHLEFLMEGPAGAQAQAYIACTGNCFSVTIDAPAAGATINQPTMVVRGTVVSSSSIPVGVVVNQYPAKVFGSSFAVDRIPVREGTGTVGATTVVVEAANACGQRATSTVEVQTTEVAGNQIQLRASPDRNVAPSQVTLQVSTDFESPATQIQWDYQGDGVIDAQGPDLREQHVTYTQPGLYVPRVSVTDSEGHIFAATAVILVEEAAALEARLNLEWSSMMAALAHGDIEGALTYIVSRKRDVMRHDWTVLKDHLQELAATFSVPLHLTDGQGKRVVAQGATPLMLGAVEFPLEVEFILDADGLWRIRNF